MDFVGLGWSNVLKGYNRNGIDVYIHSILIKGVICVNVLTSIFNNVRNKFIPKISSVKTVFNNVQKQKILLGGLQSNSRTLKLYCRYEYTKPCMINHIWGLEQLWLQVNGHAWFHLQRLCWPVLNGEGAKNSKWNYMSPQRDSNPHHASPRQESRRLRPLSHEGLMVISG